MATRHAPRTLQHDSSDVHTDATGDASLLTREQEVDIGTRMHAAHAAAWTACLPRSFPGACAARREVLGLAAATPGVTLVSGSTEATKLAAIVDEDSARWTALRTAQEAALALCETLTREDVQAYRTDRRPALDAWRTLVLSTRATLAHHFGRLVSANLRLVVSRARTIHRWGHVRLDLPDLIQEGNLGLLIAARRFDPSRGFRFSTYACWWINQSIIRGDHATGGEIRLPSYAHEQAHIVARTTRELTRSLGYEPTAEDIALASGLSLKIVDRAIAMPRRQVVSLATPLRSYEGATLADVLHDDAPSPEAALFARYEQAHCRALVANLPKRSREILARRYGLEDFGGDGEVQTLSDVGAAVGLSREGVRLYQREAEGDIRRAISPFRRRPLTSPRPRSASTTQQAR